MFHSAGPIRSLLCVTLSACLIALPTLARADDPPPPPPPPADGPPPANAPAPTPPAAPEPTPSGTGDATSAPAPAPAPETTLAPDTVLAPTPASAIVTRAPSTEIIRRRPRPGLLAPGLTLFVIGWASDIGFTYGYDHQPAYTSLIPLVGPFIQMTQKYGLDGPAVNTGNPATDQRLTKNIDTANTTIRDLAIVGAAFSAALQLSGLALTIAGAVLKRKITRFAAAPGGLALRF